MVKKIDIDKLLKGSILELSKAITLVESSNSNHRSQANDLIKTCLPYSGNSIRIGITGVPGAGKSTFIESFGKLIVKEKKKIAVLAIDPSSSKNRGSIMGDKTRMSELSQLADVFIRPSPAGEQLGGVHRATRESIILCEAAGYDTIIVETVGVGQSELAVHTMTDVFLLIAIPGAGDELQGIKRGIMEMTDIIAINKSDGDNATKAINTAQQLKSALHLFPENSNGWTTQVINCSALYDQHIEEIWTCIKQFVQHQHLNGFFESNRQDQLYNWFNESLKNSVIEHFFIRHKEQIQLMKEEVQLKLRSPQDAVDKLLRN